MLNYDPKINNLIDSIKDFSIIAKDDGVSFKSLKNSLASSIKILNSLRDNFPDYISQRLIDDAIFDIKDNARSGLSQEQKDVIDNL